MTTLVWVVFDMVFSSPPASRERFAQAAGSGLGSLPGHNLWLPLSYARYADPGCHKLRRLTPQNREKNAQQSFAKECFAVWMFRPASLS